MRKRLRAWWVMRAAPKAFASWALVLAGRRMRALNVLISIAVLCSACASCSPEGKTATADAPLRATTGEAPTAATTANVELLPPGRDPVVVRVELARTNAERQRGLMHRKHLDADAGMLFLFESPAQLTFWMRNTYVPLDMIFIESSLRVLGIVENAEPLTDTSRFVPGLSQYVLEVNAGFSRAHGFTSGMPVRFHGVPGFPAQ